jgi:hypothetical protein
MVIRIPKVSNFFLIRNTVSCICLFLGGGAGFCPFFNELGELSAFHLSVLPKLTICHEHQ